MYERTQVGIGTLVFLSVIISMTLGATAIGLAAQSLPATIICMTSFVVVLICGVIFSQMKIAIRDGQIIWQLGYGLIRRHINASEIRLCTPVQTSGLALGLRKDGNRTVWIVSGRDAVSLTLKNGNVVALGTPEKERLCEAICSLMAQTKP